MNVPSNNSLNFFDVLVIRQQNCHQDNFVYRKPSLADRYLPAQSDHQPLQKLLVRNRVISLS